jgi:hypothetical protein
VIVDGRRLRGVQVSSIKLHIANASLITTYSPYP